VRRLAAAFTAGACPCGGHKSRQRGQAPVVKAAASRRTPYCNAIATVCANINLNYYTIKLPNFRTLELPLIFPLQRNHGRSNLILILKATGVVFGDGSLTVTGGSRGMCIAKVTLPSQVCFVRLYKTFNRKHPDLQIM